MPRTLGEWLFVILSVSFWILAIVNFVLSILAYLAFTYTGELDGFDGFTLFMCLLFGFMVVGDLLAFFILGARQGKILNSLWPNIVIASVRIAYLFVAVAIFYGLLAAGSSDPPVYYWVFFSVASLFAIVNLPWLIFHLALFFPKNRKRLWRVKQDMIGRLKTLPHNS